MLNYIYFVLSINLSEVSNILHFHRMTLPSPVGKKWRGPNVGSEDYNELLLLLTTIIKITKRQ